MVCFDVCFPYWSYSSNDLLWLQCRSTGELCLVALRMLTVWLLPRSLTLPLSKTLQMPSFSLHLVRGFFPPAHTPKVHKEMDEDVILDEDWLRVMLLHFKESISDRDDISLISLWLSWVHLLPRWKIYLIELPQSGSTIIVWMRLWNWRHSIKWHLRLWVFQMDCRGDKRPVTDDLLPVGHPDIYFFLLGSPAKLQLLILKKLKTKVAFRNHMISPFMLH